MSIHFVRASSFSSCRRKPESTGASEHRLYLDTGLCRWDKAPFMEAELIHYQSSGCRWGEFTVPKIVQGVEAMQVSVSQNAADFIQRKGGRAAVDLISISS